MTGWGSACATVAGACQAMRAALITHHAAIITALLLLALPSADAAASAIDHEHRAWTQLLRKHVVLMDGGKASRVDYAGLARDREALMSYREALSQVPDHEFKRWSKGQQLAFLINAYNAAAIAKILTRYPRIGSIWDFGRLFGNPFKDRFVRLLGGSSASMTSSTTGSAAKGSTTSPAFTSPSIARPLAVRRCARKPTWLIASTRN